MLPIAGDQLVMARQNRTLGSERADSSWAAALILIMAAMSSFMTTLSADSQTIQYRRSGTFRAGSGATVAGGTV
jgi:hypothetical protein